MCSSSLRVIAKWEHIEKQYKHDTNFMIRLLYKLTETPTCFLLLSVPWKWTLPHKSWAIQEHREFKLWLSSGKETLFLFILFS